MKQLLSSALSSRHQRGYTRVTAVVLFLGLIGIGIMTIQQVKAHQYSAAKRHAAVVKIFVKDCGCSSLLSKNHSQKFYQTGATGVGDGTDNYEQAVSLKAGQRLSLGVSDPNGGIQPGGAWDANFGTVDTSGTYTAPSFTPPEGLDRVHYADTNGNDVYVTVRILPNPSIPNSDRTPTVTFDYMTGNSSVQSPDQSAQSQAGQPARLRLAQAPVTQQPAQPADTGNGSFAPVSKTIVVLPGETPAPPEQIITTASLVGETVNGASVLVLPARSGAGDTTTAIYAQPLDETPQQVTLLPSVSPPTGSCTPGSQSVYGPYYTVVTQGKMVTLADITVTSDLKAEVRKVFSITLTVGTKIHVQGQYYNWKQTRQQFNYTCVKNRWVLGTTLRCDGLATSLTTTPTWAILPTGYPQKNQPLLPYTRDACHP